MLETLKARWNQEGSTLIGLLIGIIVLAIFAAIVVSAVGTTTKNASVAGTKNASRGTTKNASASATKNASVAACNQTVETVETALEAYEAQTPTGGYPTTLAELTRKTTDTPTNPKGPWLRQVPSARLTKNGYAITYTDTATGKVTVKTKTTTLPGTTATACKAA
jgi:Tfp pilus assembly major pilin PilA